MHRQPVKVMKSFPSVTASIINKLINLETSQLRWREHTFYLPSAVLSIKRFWRRKHLFGLKKSMFVMRMNHWTLWVMPPTTFTIAQAHYTSNTRVTLLDLVDSYRYFGEHCCENYKSQVFGKFSSLQNGLTYCIPSHISITGFPNILRCFSRHIWVLQCANFLEVE